MLSFKTISAAIAALFLCVTARGAEPTASDLVRRYDELMSPVSSEALMSMVAHRQDGTTRTYKMRSLKAKGDKLRMWFLEPASAKGQEMLRVGDNLWVYMPNLKRALRLATRESFQGGDFSNGDLLRVNYRADYTAQLVPAGEDHLLGLDLSAKSDETTYARIKLWMSKDKKLPVRAEYYATSGKLLRSATFSDVKTLHGVEVPTRITMRNELATKRFSEMFILDRKINVEVPEQTFVLDALGR